jgi:transcription antitermination factor NusG
MNAVMIPRPTLSNIPAAEESVLGSTRNLEDGYVSTNVSMNDKLSEGVSDERKVKKNVGTKRKINFQEDPLQLQKRKIKLMEERPMIKSQADEDYMFLMSLLPSIKKLDDIQRLEVRTEFLSSVTRRIQISKNLSQPFNSAPIIPNSSCLPSTSPRAAILD